MSNPIERRKERRLPCSWPMCFGRYSDETYSQGRTIDISSTHVSFYCCTKDCPAKNESIVIRFGVPRYNSDGSMQREDFTRFGNVFRINEMGPNSRLIVVEFTQSLPFKPGEQELNGANIKQGS